ncbi:MAG: HyaD/HybD family hydrogenase maturation endopeptidase [Acidobacteria bacterium]|nr:HyaD/HybD family hydrogenase maturation endopeptidase [Acidobacteriota bacterium]MDW7983120.1 HyaD/HybD family hydrogenase maturation endopeptidase [Acidobacteriota bacterium]
MSITVVGLGNLLMGDEGVGVHAVRVLRERLAWPDVTYLDGGTLGLSLLPYLEEAVYLLFLDAIRADAPPGTVFRLSLLDEPIRIPLKVSAHDIALPDLVALLKFRRGEALQAVELLGVVPERVEPSMELSPTVQASLPDLVSWTLRILQAWSASERPPREQRAKGIGWAGGSDVFRCAG